MSVRLLDEDSNDCCISERKIIQAYGLTDLTESAKGD
jgi:hypothetical protein